MIPSRRLLKLAAVNRTERLLDLITYLLNTQEPVSWQEIKNHFPDDYGRGIEESNQRKFERDKAELISLGIPIDYQTGSELRREGYIIRKDKLFLPEIQFSPRESSLLMLSATAVLENENFPYRDQLSNALHKILSIQNILQPPPARMRITFQESDRSRQREIWMTEIQDALERRKWLEIDYHAFSTGRTEKRKVDPYGLIYRDRNWTLIGWDHLRKDIRSFVLTRILSLRVNPKRPGTPDYQIPKDFSLKSYQNLQPWDFAAHAPIEVELEISPHRLQELAPQLQGADQVSNTRFVLQIKNRESLVSWVLSQKTDVRVVRPREIQDDIRSALRELK